MNAAMPQSPAAAGPIGIVDDDPFVAESLGELLHSYGFETLIHDAGPSLLADPRRTRLRCLLIDFHMPQLDGLEVVAALRREGSAVPCILITGRYEPRIAARAAALGLVDILEKPFVGGRLIEAVRIASSASNPGEEDGGDAAVPPSGASRLPDRPCDLRS